MTTYHIVQIDAFTDRVFAGNPAACMIVDEEFSADLMQKIAMENNLAETAYAIPRGEGRYGLRWFTPGAEVPLCGHATLAMAHMLWTELDEASDRLTFETLSGELHVMRDGDGYALDFPADPPSPIEGPVGLAETLGAMPFAILGGQYLLAVFEDPDVVINLQPDLLRLSAIQLARGRGRFRIALLCPCGGDSRRSRHRLRALYAYALLGRSFEQNRDACLPSISARRPCGRCATRRSRCVARAGLHLSAR